MAQLAYNTTDHRIYHKCEQSAFMRLFRVMIDPNDHGESRAMYVGHHGRGYYCSHDLRYIIAAIAATTTTAAVTATTNSSRTLHDYDCSDTSPHPYFFSIINMNIIVTLNIRYGHQKHAVSLYSGFVMFMTILLLVIYFGKV